MSNICHSNEFISAVFGAFVGGLFVLTGIMWKNYCDNISEKIKTKHILEGLNKESNILINIMQDIFEMIKNTKNGEAIFYSTCVTQNYFSLYEKNSDVIGSISNIEYKEAIVKFYLLAKRLTDALVSNGNYLEQGIRSLLSANHQLVQEALIKNTQETLVKEATHLKKLAKDIEEQLDIYNKHHKNYLDKLSLSCFSKLFCCKKI